METSKSFWPVSISGRSVFSTSKLYVSVVFNAVLFLSSPPGLMSVVYTYQSNTNLVKNINVAEPGFELKHEIRYHLGMIKDERYMFSAKCGLHNAHFK